MLRENEALDKTYLLEGPVSRTDAGPFVFTRL